MSIRNKINNLTYTLSIGHFILTIKPLPTLLILIMLPSFISLGSWQYSKGERKKSSLLKIMEALQNEPQNIKVVDELDLEHSRFLLVGIDGVFLNKYTFLLDNQVYDHRAGYKVITVLQAPGLHKWALIDRGWVPLGKNRRDLPEIKPLYGLVRINGVINNISVGIKLEKETIASDAAWPIVIQSLDYKLIGEYLNHEVYDFIVQIVDQDKTDFTVVPLNTGLDPSKNFAYAIQWYIFAILLCIYYLIVSISRNKGPDENKLDTL